MSITKSKNGFADYSDIPPESHHWVYPYEFLFCDSIFEKKRVLGIREGIFLLGKGVEIVNKSYHWLPVRCFAGLPLRVFKRDKR